MNISEKSIKNIEIFSTLNDDEVKSFFSILKPYTVESGKTIFSEGDAGYEMFIVTEGCIGIYVTPDDGQKIEIAKIEAGNFFGEMSVFDNSPRSATCIAKEDSRLLGLSGSIFLEYLETHPESAIKIIHKMVNNIAVRLEHVGAFLSDIVQWGDKARRRAITDEYTGLYNRRFYDDSIKENFEKAKDSGSHLSLIMLDLDRFGTLNKEYGQKKGDEIILKASTVFKDTFRPHDILVRYGGDEFIFIMKETGSDAAEKVCNQVVERLRDITLTETEGKSVKQITGSIGIATFPSHAENIDQLKDAADKAVYLAKEAGRNCTMIYTNNPAK